jgi:hypothetical protein
MGYQVMANPIIREHNIQTNEVIDREMTDDEFTKFKADKAKVVAEQLEVKAKTTARQEILDRLGLTADEAAILLG